jgi:hypothetical protein
MVRQRELLMARYTHGGWCTGQRSGCGATLATRSYRRTPDAALVPRCSTNRGCPHLLNVRNDSRAVLLWKSIEGKVMGCPYGRQAAGSHAVASCTVCCVWLDASSQT